VGFAFTVKLGLLWDFEQVLIVCAAMYFCECLLKWIRNKLLHGLAPCVAVVVAWLRRGTVGGIAAQGLAWNHRDQVLLTARNAGLRCSYSDGVKF
jgi:hypothetical protein